MPHYVGATIITPPNHIGATMAPPFAARSQLHEQWNRDILAGHLRCFAGFPDCLSRAREDWETAQDSCKQDRDQDSLHFKFSSVYCGLESRCADRTNSVTKLCLPLALARIKILAQAVADEVKC